MNFATLDLNLLRVLDALLHEGSTVKAGERLGMSQSAVSGALARLRHALGDPLFVRHGQGLRATDYAASLATPLRVELDRLEELLRGGARFVPEEAELSFKIAGSDFFAEMLMPPLATRLRRKAPGIRVQLVDLVPYSYVETLERYEADLVLLPDTQLPDWVERSALFRSSFVAIAARDNPQIAAAGIEAGNMLPIDLFCDLGHVLFSPEGKTSAMGDAALARVGRQRRVVMTMPVFSGVCRSVSVSELIALVPRQLAEHLADQLALSIYLPPMPIDPPLIISAWHRRSSANPAHRYMREEIAQVLSQLNEGEEPLP